MHEAEHLAPRPIESESDQLRALFDMQAALAGEVDDLMFISASGRKTNIHGASYVLLTRERFIGLMHARLTELDPSPPGEAKRLLDMAMKYDRRPATVRLDNVAVRDMAHALVPDPLGPVKLGRKERRAEERRRRRGGR